MVNYQNGKIYKLWSIHTEKIYIGSTCNLLSKRLSGHRRTTETTSRELFEYGEVKIELIETFPCVTKEELTAREGYYIRTLDCVNKCIPGRTKEEWNEEHKEYSKSYREQTKGQKAKYDLINYQDNREDRIQKQKEYFKLNKEEIIIKRKEKFNCECGGKYTMSGKSQHMKTEKHKNFFL